MPSVRPLAFALLLFAALAASGCTDPPDKEIQQAQEAIGLARAAGADTYARAEFTAAEDALKQSRQAVTDRDYRLALNHALDARERAQNAAREAADRKAAARTEADRAVRAGDDALTVLNTKVKSAEAARAPARVLADARRVAADGGQDLQEARKALESGDYAAVIARTNDTTPRLLEAARELDGAIAPAVRRRR
jgi:hypothetical protein